MNIYIHTYGQIYMSPNNLLARAPIRNKSARSASNLVCTLAIKQHLHV